MLEGDGLGNEKHLALFKTITKEGNSMTQKGFKHKLAAILTADAGGLADFRVHL